MEIVYSKSVMSQHLQNPLSIYVLFGDDDHSKNEAIDLLVAELIDPDFADFDFEILDADNNSVEDILSSSSMVPFNSKRRLVIVRGAQVFKKRDKTSDIERLIDGISKLSSVVTLVFRVASDEEGSRAKTAISVKFDNAVKTKGALINCKQLTETELIAWIHSEIQIEGKTIAAEAAQRLTQASQGHRLALHNEMEKAICFAGNAKHVTLEAVEAVATFDPEDVMFKLVDAITKRQTDLALKLFYEILRRENKPQAVAGRLLALLSRQYRMLFQAYELAQVKIDPNTLKSLPEEIGNQLPSEGSILTMVWKARDLFGAARGLDRKLLIRSFDLILECDMANKGGQEGSEDVVTNLQLLILKLCSLK